MNSRSPISNSQGQDPEGEILAMGWDTECTSDIRKRAMHGPQATRWCKTWSEVLEEIYRGDRLEAV
jgi:hypothetical protein